MSSLRFGPDNPAATYVSHAFAEQTIDTGEVVINYATVGAPEKPALLLNPHTQCPARSAALTTKTRRCSFRRSTPLVDHLTARASGRFSP